MRFLILLLMLLFIPLAQAAVLDIQIGPEKVVMPGGNQTLAVTLFKPPLFNPVEIELYLKINGSAYFPNGEKEIRTYYEKINWSRSIIKKEKYYFPIIMKSMGNTVEEIVVDAQISYHNTLFGYKKTEKTTEQKTINFTTIWTITDKETNDDIFELKKDYEMIKEEYKILQSELVSQSERISQLKQENNELKADNSSLRSRHRSYLFYMISTYVLLIVLAYLVFEQFYHKKFKR